MDNNHPANPIGAEAIEALAAALQPEKTHDQ